MDLRAILARQLSKSLRCPSPPPAPLLPKTPPMVHSPPPSSTFTATAEDPVTLVRKRKRLTTPGPEALVTVPGDIPTPEFWEIGPIFEQQGSPPQFPAHYTATSNIFLESPSSSLDFEILHSLGSDVDRQHMSAMKLWLCTLNQANDLVRVNTLIVFCYKTFHPSLFLKRKKFLLASRAYCR